MKKVSLQTNDLADFQQWKVINDEDFSLIDYLYFNTSFDLAIAFTKLFWPDFIEYKNGIFFQDSFDVQIYNEWAETLGNEIFEIEKILNHRHMEDFFQSLEGVSDNNLLYLGQVIAEMWQARLNQVYPDRHFRVECSQGDCETVVTFWQIS